MEAKNRQKIDEKDIKEDTDIIKKKYWKSISW
jgi:hypothetical protein